MTSYNGGLFDEKEDNNIIILVLILLSFSKSFAYIIDTGTPTSAWMVELNDLWRHQPYVPTPASGQFVLNNSYNITSIAGFLYPEPSSGGSLTLAVYGNKQINFNYALTDVPNVNSQYLSTTFNAAGSKNWFGPTDINLSLGPGTYWATFEVRENDTFPGGMPVDAPYPLPNYAQVYNNSYQPAGFTFPPYFSSGWGLRIAGDPAASPAIADIPVDPQARIIEGVQADNKTFSWPGFYNLSFANSQLSVDLDIQLVGYNPGDTLKNLWERGIEDNWNNQYMISDGQYSYPLVFNVYFVDNSPLQVTVHEGTGRFSRTDWYTGFPDEYEHQVVAHEAGHMFGLFDEYDPAKDAVLDPKTLFWTTDPVMMNDNSSYFFEHYFENILAWLEGESGRDLDLLMNAYAKPYPYDPQIFEFYDGPPGSASAVPEPSTMLLLCLGLIGLAGVRRRLMN